MQSNRDRSEAPLRSREGKQGDKRGMVKSRAAGRPVDCGEADRPVECRNLRGLRCCRDNVINMLIAQSVSSYV